MGAARQIDHFDPIEFMKQSRARGVSQDVAELYAQTLAKIVEENQNNQNLATKIDLAKHDADIRADLAKLEMNIRGDLAKQKEELKADIVKQKEDLKADIAKLDIRMSEMRYELIKWIIGVGATSVITMAGLIKWLH